MRSAEQAIERIEAAGGVLRVDGEHIRCNVPEDATDLLTDLRLHKSEVLTLLRERAAVPSMPKGVHLVRWEPKPAPIAITQVEIVTDVPRFVTMTLLELKAALRGKRWLAGNRSVRELIERLDECGVVVELDGPTAVNTGS